MSHPLRKAIFHARCQAINKNPIVRRCIANSFARYDVFNVESTEDFDRKVKQSNIPVVVDFFSTWRSPCKTLTERIETVVSEKDGAISLAYVDIDEHSGLASDYDVGAVPALMVMKDGKVLKRMVGVQETHTLRAWIHKIMSRAE